MDTTVNLRRLFDFSQLPIVITAAIFAALTVAILLMFLYTLLKNYKPKEKIIEEPAPSFYLDTETFRCLLYKALRERNHELAFCKI